MPPQEEKIAAPASASAPAPASAMNRGGVSSAARLVLDSERSSLLDSTHFVQTSEASYAHHVDVQTHTYHFRRRVILVLAGLAIIASVGVRIYIWQKSHQQSKTEWMDPTNAHTNADQDAEPPVVLHPTGPYKLVQVQQGRSFFNHYDFYVGADSIGSAGYQMYVNRSEAVDLGIIGVGSNIDQANAEAAANDSETTDKDDQDVSAEEDFVFMSSAPYASDGTDPNMRSSVRIEGKTRFNRGLFILDVRHMPVGCGVWNAFWMTDEDAWPENGEIDIVEGVNYQSKVKTALHTSDKCSMYAHVPDYDYADGEWERATGIPNTFTGAPDYETSLPADNCYVMAPHQWANQGCIIRHKSNKTIGIPINQAGGAVYVLEWDPANGYIKSWVFSNDTTPVPQNLKDAIDTATDEDAVMPDPDLWMNPKDSRYPLLPYAYFAIGEGSGCSSDHFKNMRLIFNTAFCGTVAGNRYPRDCPAQAKEFSFVRTDGSVDPVLSCNKWIASNPDELSEAYWKIKGLYVYERENVSG